MAEKSSSEAETVQLFNPNETICATNQKFCFHNSTLLYLNQNIGILTDNFEVVSKNGVEVTTHLKCVRNRLSNLWKISDGSDNPLFRLQRHGRYDSVFEGFDALSRKKLCEFTADLINLNIVVKFEDAVTKEKRVLMLNGKYLQPEVLVYFERSSKDNTAVPVAKITCTSSPSTFRHALGNHVVEVAENIDSALIVMLCIAFATIQRPIKRVNAVFDGIKSVVTSQPAKLVSNAVIQVGVQRLTKKLTEK